MMKEKKDEIIDLVPEKDGVYSTKSGHHPIEEQKEKPLPDNITNLFAGIDMGLQFLEGVDKRVSRMMKLKK